MLCTLQSSSAGTGSALGSFILFSAALLLLSHNRHILSASSLIKQEPFHRPARTIVSQPLLLNRCDPFLRSRAPREHAVTHPPLRRSQPQNPTPKPSSPCRGLQGALCCCSLPLATWCTAMPWNRPSRCSKPKPPRINFSREETRARGIFFTRLQLCALLLF